MAGYPENVRNENKAIGTTPLLVSPARPRRELVITNTSSAAQAITLGFGSVPSNKVGVYLLPYSSYYASATDGFIVWEGEIWAISDAAAGAISIFER